jgi:tetratricopeptide (TPR) repeat protein
MMSKNKNILYLSLTLFFVVIAAYANHFENEFHFDDFHTIVNNPHIRSLKNIPQFFTDPMMFSVSQNHYGLRPLVTTSVAIDYWLGGGQMLLVFFHLSTFIWFLALGVILYFVYRKLLKNSFSEKWVAYISLFAVGWFMLHTANAETINYIISRSDVLSTFLIVASFAIYILYPERRKYFLYIIPAVIGVFAKETVLVLIILLFFYILLFERNLSVADLFKGRNFKVILNTVWILMPVFLAVAAVQFYTLSAISSIPGISNPAGYYWLTQTYVWLYYFGSFFLPIHLSADTDWSVIMTVADRRILIGLIFFIALMIAIFRTSRKTETKPIAFGLIWFAASLLPTSLAPFAEVMNDHRMFFAFIGLSLSVVTWIGLWLSKREKQIELSKSWQYGILVGAFLILGLNAFGVHQRNKVWATEESLWYDVTIKSPNNGRGLMNYGLSQMAKGNYVIAEDYFQKALVLLPSYNHIYTNLGIVMGAQNKIEEAEQNFNTAITLTPNDFSPYAYYARFLKEKGRYQEAVVMAEKALSLNKYSIMTLSILMSAYEQLQQWDKLQQTAQMTLNIVPNDAEALRYIEAARQRKPLAAAPAKDISAEALKAKTPEDLLNLSLTMYNLGEYEKCIEFAQAAINLKPDYADAYSNMSASYNQLKQWDKGAEAAKKALAIDPNHTYAKGNLNWALSQSL